jgi:hypothetical protein
MELAVYEAFDDFCRRPTWDTSHPSDVQVFRVALRSAVRQQGFSPDEMGEYIRRNHSDPIWPKSEAELDKVILGLVREARTALGRIKS